MALCLGAVLGPIAGLVVAPFAFIGAACALMSLVIACVEVQETSRTKDPTAACGARSRDAA